MSSRPTRVGSDRNRTPIRRRTRQSTPDYGEDRGKRPWDDAERKKKAIAPASVDRRRKEHSRRSGHHRHHDNDADDFYMDVSDVALGELLSNIERGIPPRQQRAQTQPKFRHQLDQFLEGVDDVASLRPYQTILRLPNEILLEISEYCDIDSFLAFSATCRLTVLLLLPFQGACDRITLRGFELFESVKDEIRLKDERNKLQQKRPRQSSPLRMTLKQHSRFIMHKPSPPRTKAYSSINVPISSDGGATSGLDEEDDAEAEDEDSEEGEDESLAVARAAAAGAEGGWRRASRAFRALSQRARQTMDDARMPREAHKAHLLNTLKNIGLRDGWLTEEKVDQVKDFNGYKRQWKSYHEEQRRQEMFRQEREIQKARQERANEGNGWWLLFFGFHCEILACLAIFTVLILTMITLDYDHISITYAFFFVPCFILGYFMTCAYCCFDIIRWNKTGRSFNTMEETMLSNFDSRILPKFLMEIIDVWRYNADKLKQYYYACTSAGIGFTLIGLRMAGVPKLYVPVIYWFFGYPVYVTLRYSVWPSVSNHSYFRNYAYAKPRFKFAIIATAVVFALEVVPLTMKADFDVDMPWMLALTGLYAAQLVALGAVLTYGGIHRWNLCCKGCAWWCFSLVFILLQCFLVAWALDTGHPLHSYLFVPILILSVLYFGGTGFAVLNECYLERR